MSLSPIRIVVTGALADPLAGKADQSALDALATTVADKAGTATATQSSNGLMSASSKLKLDGIEPGAQVNATATATQTSNGLMSAASKLKLDGIDVGATANASNAQLRDRATHSGAQAIATVTGLQAALDGKISRAAPSITTDFDFAGHHAYNVSDAVSDNDGPNLGQVVGAITASVNTAIAGSFSRSLLATSALTTAPLFRAAIGAASTAVATTGADGLLSVADKTKLNGVASGAQVNTITSVAGRTGAIVLARADVGLGSVDDTADADKPISAAVQTALNGKAGTAAATTTVAGLLAAADKLKLDGIAAGAQVNAVASVAGRTGAVTLAKGDVGLANVDNSSDANKPLSTAMVAALAGKAATALATVSADGLFAAADKAKLNGVAAGATANAADAALRDRATHSGAQAIATVTGLQAALDGKAALAAPIQTQGKPGDVLDRFTATLNGAAAAGAVPAGTLVENDAMGAALRQSGASVTALRERIAVWPDRILRVRARVQRATAPTDPAGDTVRFAVNRLTKAKGTISTPTVVADVNLAVLPDPTIIEAVFAAAAGAGIDFTWTATTRYIVPFVQTFGADGVTDIGEIAWEDITDGFAIGQGLAAEETARIAAFGAEQAARIANDDAEQAARIAAVAAEADARGAAVTVLQGNIDAGNTAIAATQADALDEKLRARRVALAGLGQNVEDVETLAIRGGRRAMGVDANGRLLALGLDSKWADGLEGEHRLAIVGDGEMTSFALNRDGTIFLVPDEATKAQLGGAIAAIDVPHALFEREVFGAAYLSPSLTRAFSSEEGQTYAYVYRRDRPPLAAIREGRAPIEGIDSNGQSLEVGGGAAAASPHVLTTTPLRPHLNLSLDDGLRGPGSTPWNPASAADFKPAVEVYNAAKNEGETGQTATMRWLSARQAATGRIQTPFVARADGRGGTLLADLVKGSVPYANSLAALRRMGEIACETYRRPFVVRCTPFGQGNADRASATPRQDWVDMLVQYAADNSADVLALLGELADAYPDLYADVTLPTRIPLITAQLTDAISSTGDTADDIIFAHVDAAEQSNLIFVSHPQYFFKDDYGYVDAAHLQALGYCVKGEYHAQAYERVVWNGEGVGGLFPDRANTVRSGGNIVVPVLGAVGALRLNTTDLPAAAGSGFNWSGAGSVTGVSFSGSTIVIAGTTGSGTLTYGARHQASAKPAGSYSYGNVCDSNPADSIAVPGLKLTNWLPAFDKSL